MLYIISVTLADLQLNPIRQSKSAALLRIQFQFHQNSSQKSTPTSSVKPPGNFPRRRRRFRYIKHGRQQKLIFHRYAAPFVREIPLSLSAIPEHIIGKNTRGVERGVLYTLSKQSARGPRHFSAIQFQGDIAGARAHADRYKGERDLDHRVRCSRDRGYIGTCIYI